MSLAVGISVGTAIAVSASAAARRTACEAIELTFVNQGSDVAGRVQFANCVHLLHPDDLSSSSRLVLKILLVLFFALWAGSAVLFKRGDWNDWAESLIYGFITAFVTYAAGGALLLAVLFLFS